MFRPLAPNGEDIRSPLIGDAGKRRVLLLGGCQVANLRAELGEEFAWSHHWYRPTIALMSEPVRPAAALGFDDRHARYVVEDCTKQHLARLQETPCDIFVFELVRDVRCPLVRQGRTYVFDPNEMWGRVADTLPLSERFIDVAALLGTSETETLAASVDPHFFDVWAAHFDRFHEAVLAPRIAEGCVVIVQQLYLAKQTVPPSDVLQIQWAYCDALNALLRKMYAHVATYPGIRRIGVGAASCLTSSDAPYGGPYITHPVREVFLLMADQTRELLAPERPISSTTTAVRGLPWRRAASVSMGALRWAAGRNPLPIGR